MPQPPLSETRALDSDRDTWTVPGFADAKAGSQAGGQMGAVYHPVPPKMLMQSWVTRTPASEQATLACE